MPCLGALVLRRSVTAACLREEFLVLTADTTPFMRTQSTITGACLTKSTSCDEVAHDNSVSDPSD